VWGVIRVRAGLAARAEGQPRQHVAGFFWGGGNATTVRRCSRMQQHAAGFGVEGCNHPNAAAAPAPRTGSYLMAGLGASSLLLSRFHSSGWAAGMLRWVGRRGRGRLVGGCFRGECSRGAGCGDTKNASAVMINHLNINRYYLVLSVSEQQLVLARRGVAQSQIARSSKGAVAEPQPPHLHAPSRDRAATPRRPRTSCAIHEKAQGSILDGFRASKRYSARERAAFASRGKRGPGVFKACVMGNTHVVDTTHMMWQGMARRVEVEGACFGHQQPPAGTEEALLLTAFEDRLLHPDSGAAQLC